MKPKPKFKVGDLVLTVEYPLEIKEVTCYKGKNVIKAVVDHYCDAKSSVMLKLLPPNEDCGHRGLKPFGRGYWYAYERNLFPLKKPDVLEDPELKEIFI